MIGSLSHTVAPPKQPVVMMRNPYYYKVDPEGNQLPYTDRFAFITADEESMTLKVVAGEIAVPLFPVLSA